MQKSIFNLSLAQRLRLGALWIVGGAFAIHQLSVPNAAARFALTLGLTLLAVLAQLLIWSRE